MKEIVHFAHGNGFPSPCYRQLLMQLETRYDCCYIDRVGHNPQFPVTENWQFLVEELIESVKQQASKPVIGVGHSLGGVLSVLAAIEEPSLFKAVVMIDSPLMGRLKSRIVSLAKSMGFIDNITPAARTRGRREHWSNRKQLIDYLRSKALFKTFTEACLDDYINYGFIKMDTGEYELRFDSRIEYSIYRTIPHVLREYEGKLHIPTTLIYGDQSTVVKAGDIRYMQEKFNISNVSMKGTHMLPMEHPTELAQLIFKIMKEH